MKPFGLFGLWPERRLDLLRELGCKISRFTAANTHVKRLEGGGCGVLCCASRVADGSIGRDLLLHPPKELRILQSAAPFVVGLLYVLHCHNLEHEDMMMANFAVA